MSADDFLVTPCNKEAAAWVDRWPDWPSHGLVLTGLPGSGKTHLASLWLEKAGGIGLTKDALMKEDWRAFPTKNVAFDNAERLAGDALAEEQLFHLFNALKESGGFLLLTLPRGVSHTGFLLPDLRSRLLTLPSAVLKEPDDTLLQALILKQFADRQVTLGAGVLDYMASRLPRDAASVRTLVDKLDKMALAEGRKISVALVRNFLENLCE